MEKIEIIKVTDKNEKSEIVRDVLLDLPEWFGLPESTEEYIEDARGLPLWVAKEEEETIGFVTLKEATKDCGDVHCTGVKKAYHRQGIGHLLMSELVEEAKTQYEYLQVKTVDEGHYKEYDQTIAFYRNFGFRKLEVFPTLWDEWNPCLIMVMKI